MGGHFQWVTKAKWKTLPPPHITQETQYHQIREIHTKKIRRTYSCKIDKLNDAVSKFNFYPNNIHS